MTDFEERLKEQEEYYGPAAKDLNLAFRDGARWGYAHAEAEIRRLREALEFYADQKNWYDPREIDGSYKNGVWGDSENILINILGKYETVGGKRARAALKEGKE